MGTSMRRLSKAGARQPYAQACTHVGAGGFGGLPGLTCLRRCCAFVATRGGNDSCGRCGASRSATERHGAYRKNPARAHDEATVGAL